MRRSALPVVNGLAVDDRGILGEHQRRAVPGCRTRGRNAFTADSGGVALARGRGR